MVFLLKLNFRFLIGDCVPQFAQNALETSEPQFAQYAN
jgi:hypothetical protein